LIAAQAEQLDALDAAEMGKPVSEATSNAMVAAELLQFYAEALDKLTGDVCSSDRNSFVAQRRVPRGVVAAVVPWNFPAFNATLKFAPALAAGNCVVLKLQSCLRVRRYGWRASPFRQGCRPVFSTSCRARERW
jgi:acyl-CoA reductase-like NAD-dependent aldehyde dehydrogenase